MNEHPEIDVAPAFPGLREQLVVEASRRPLATVAACAGAGYLLGKVPVLGLGAMAVRLALPVARPLLCAIGIARVWDLVAPRRGSLAGTGAGVIDALRALNRAAVASYDRIAPLFDGAERDVVSHLRAVHQDGERLLQQAGAKAVSGSRATWETLEDHLSSSGGLLSEAPVFSLMLSEEEAYTRALEAALEERRLGEEEKTLIRRHLLPRAQENLNSLLRRRQAGNPVALT